MVGLSFDFLALNFLGFVCYSVYNVALLASPTVRADYRRQMGGSPGVRLNDAIFAVHAMIMTSAGSCSGRNRPCKTRASRKTGSAGSLLALSPIALLWHLM